MADNSSGNSRKGTAVAIISAIGTVVAAVAAAAVTGVFGLIDHPFIQQISGQAAPMTPVAAAPMSPSSDTGVASPDVGAVAPVSDPTAALIFDGEVKLPQRSAVDVDHTNATPIKDQSGPTGSLDIFHSGSSNEADTLRVQPGNVWTYPGGKSTSASIAHDTCAGYADPASGTSANSFEPLYANYSFCFVTSDRHLAWANIEAVDSNSESTATLRVRVWNTVIPG